MRALLKLAIKNNKAIIGATLGLIALETLSVYGLYKLNGVYGELYQAIQEYRPTDIWNAIWTFSVIAGGLSVLNSLIGARANVLSFAIREGLTRFALEKITPDPPYKHISSDVLLGQRIQEDTRRFGESVVEIGVALFKAAVKLPLFLGVVISLTDVKAGLIIFVAVVVGTVLTKIVSGRLVHLQSEQESNEARFRSSLTELDFDIVKTKFQQINSKLKVLLLVQSGLGQGFALLPFIVLMPLYISKAVTMGAFFQAVNALSKIVDSLSVIIDNRNTLVNIETAKIRLKFLTK